MSVLDACGNKVDDADVRVLGYDMSVGIATPTAGRHLVEWTTLSALDGHTARGTWEFTVAGVPPSCGTASTEATPSAPPVATGFDANGPVSRPVGATPTPVQSVVVDHAEHNRQNPDAVDAAVPTARISPRPLVAAPAASSGPPIAAGAAVVTLLAGLGVVVGFRVGAR